jgi:hypothetical protein
MLLIVMAVNRLLARPGREPRSSNIESVVVSFVATSGGVMVSSLPGGSKQMFVLKSQVFIART